MPRFVLLMLMLGMLARADVSQCACDPKQPDSMKVRQCSLCWEAEKQQQDIQFFLLKDISPRKPNRWLVLPRDHHGVGHDLHNVPKVQRDGLWRYALQVAREKFGEEWGIAYNGARVRTQCHMHLHVGRFIRASENSKFILVRRLENFPAPEEGGIWVHPVAGGFHVHTGEQIMETALVR